MHPSQPNANAGASSKDAEASRLTNSGGKKGSSFQSSNPSAPLLPSSPYNPEVMNLEPPPYSSVVAQDASDLRNQFGSSSAGNVNQAGNQAPYPTGPGSATQTPYPPRGGYSAYGAPAQAPYPTGSGSGPQGTGNQPYPGGPGYTHGPASQAPYPPGPMPMPMPGPVDRARQIGFTIPVTEEPKISTLGFRPTLDGRISPNPTNCDQETQEELMYAARKAAETRKKWFAAILSLVIGFICIVLFALVKHIASFYD